MGIKLLPIRRILRPFALDLSAGQVADMTRINRNSVNRYLRLKERENWFNRRPTCHVRANLQRVPQPERRWSMLQGPLPDSGFGF